MVFSTHTLLLGEVIPMRYDGGFIVNGVFAVGRQVKISQETEWCEGDQARILPKIALGPVVQTLHRKRRAARERMQGCAALPARGVAKKE